MRNKILHLFLMLIWSSLLCLAQEEKSILSAPEDWRSEIIPFPLSFATQIEFEGIEEIQFAPGWSDPESAEFWAYSFVWYIEKQSPMTEQILTESFNYYYDGLMKAVAENQQESSASTQFDKALCLFVRTEDGFTGKMRVYDAFFLKDYITLNIRVKESFCLATGKQMVLFDISPKSLDDELWKIFDNVKLNVPCD